MCFFINPRTSQNTPSPTSFTPDLITPDPESETAQEKQSKPVLAAELAGAAKDLPKLLEAFRVYKGF